MREYTFTIHETDGRVYADCTEPDADPATRRADSLLIMATIWATFWAKGVSRRNLNKWLYAFEAN